MRRAGRNREAVAHTAQSTPEGLFRIIRCRRGASTLLLLLLLLVKVQYNVRVLLINGCREHPRRPMVMAWYGNGMAWHGMFFLGISLYPLNYLLSFFEGHSSFAGAAAFLSSGRGSPTLWICQLAYLLTDLPSAVSLIRRCTCITRITAMSMMF